MERPAHLIIMSPQGTSEAAMLVPVVCALRHAYPALHITIFSRGEFRAFFSGIENVDFMDSAPLRRAGIVKLWQFANKIRAMGADCVADLCQSGTTKALRMILSNYGLAVSVLERDIEAEKRLTRRSGKQLEPLVSEVELYRKAIVGLGLEFGLPAGNECERELLRLQPKVGTAVGVKNGTWVGVAPFASHKGKIYPIPLADKLIEILSARYERVIILGSGEYERGFAEGMEKRHGGTLSIVDKFDLSHEMEIISNLDVVVSMDSAPMHIASLAGIPVVSVWGATHPYAGRYGFGQDPANAVQLDMPCRPCSISGTRKCIFGHYHCLTLIPPEMIAEAVEKAIRQLITNN